eukprot:TRINITY_DN13023_c0_g1_i1.p1 TRINITY_DN13023_c0_g1~~TRINITY_DN13023_c0_g1_i1.p1  ORF type:complete len:435 (-),score=75.23 TRINITY_DN13023_c0_g1_i1:59-1297(-)
MAADAVSASTVPAKPASALPAAAAFAGALEMLRQLQTSKTADLQAEGGGKAEEDVEMRRCRPESLPDYYRRLRTFQAPTWFNKPAGISPIQCARRGWTNSGQDKISCPCCGREVEIVKIENVWHVDGVRRADLDQASQEEWSNLLVTHHSQFCPWRSCDVYLADPLQLLDKEIVEGVEQRLRGLQSGLRCRPVLVGEEQELSSPLQVLARAYWEFAGRDEVNVLDFIRCALCLRTVCVQSFRHLALQGDATTSSSSSSTQGKRGRSQADDAAAAAPVAKAARLAGEGAQVLAPRAGLWTPKAELPSDRAQAGEGLFDAHALHRFYCPMYARSDDDLTPAAERIIKCCVSARASAARNYIKAKVPKFEVGRPGRPGEEAVAEGGAGADKSTGAEAVARAEDLLKRLQEVLASR